MAGENYIPDRTVNYNVYNEDNNILLGIATVELPSIEKQTETLSGAGIGGELETVIPGHTGSMTVTVNWNSITPDGLKLLNNDSNSLTFRGAMRLHNASGATHSVRAVRIVVRGQTKTSALGTLEVNAKAEMTTEIEASYLRIFIDDEEMLEIDKLNLIYKVNGNDELADTRTAMGLS